jgi:hypothetical protein
LVFDVGAGFFAGSEAEEPLGFGSALGFGATLGFGAVSVFPAVDPPTEARALRAESSSTLDAAALASMPAAFRAASSSLLVTPADLAIS